MDRESGRMNQDHLTTTKISKRKDGAVMFVTLRFRGPWIMALTYAAITFAKAGESKAFGMKDDVLVSMIPLARSKSTKRKELIVFECTWKVISESYSSKYSGVSFLFDSRRSVLCR